MCEVDFWKLKDESWCKMVNCYKSHMKCTFMCIYNFGGLKTMNHQPANYQWTMVCQSAWESSQKYQKIRPFFENFCRWVFFAAGAGCRGWLHAHRGSGTTVQVCWWESQSLGCFGIVVMANQPMKARVVWNLLGFPGLFLVFLIALEWKRLVRWETRSWSSSIQSSSEMQCT